MSKINSCKMHHIFALLEKQMDPPSSTAALLERNILVRRECKSQENSNYKDPRQLSPFILPRLCSFFFTRYCWENLKSPSHIKTTSTQATSNPAGILDGWMMIMYDLIFQYNKHSISFHKTIYDRQPLRLICGIGYPVHCFLWSDETEVWSYTMQFMGQVAQAILT